MTAECLTPFVIVRSERDLSAAILVAKFTCIERVEEVTLIFRKYLRTLLPIILSGTLARQERQPTKVNSLRA